MANKLFSLFEDKLRAPQDLVASTPQNLQSIGQQVEDPTAILRMIQQFEVVRPKADYRDFSKFVFFNSAEDYFNITGEKILNYYPYDASSADLQFWLNSLDEYQRYTVGVWPKSQGHLRFNPANGFAYIKVDDVWKDGEVTKTSLLNPGTGSLSIEFWTVPPPALTGSEDAMMVVQKISGSTSDGYSAYFSGSNICFAIVSGASADQVTVPTTPGTAEYFCFTVDRSGNSTIVTAFSGSSSRFPRLVTYVTSSITGPITAGSSPLHIASGSASGKRVIPLTGSIDDLRIWSTPLGLSQITASFNARVTAQDGLLALWRFNETGSLPTGQREVVKDASGHRLNGIIRNYYSSVRGSGSLLPFDQSDLVMSLDEPVVNAYVAQQQASGSLYDKYNDNLITRLLPEQFFMLEEFKNTTVLRDFLYVIARYFDNLKVMIDQFAHVLKNDYGRYDNTPDALLQDIGKFFGWEFTGNFLNNDAIQYILGRQVLPNLEYNRSLDMKLYEIKNEFWKRSLINLMHLYKTKGTRESVEAVMRIYGVNKNFIRLKEYGYKPNAGIQTHRINSEKSTYVVKVDGNSRIWNSGTPSTFETVEIRAKFPTETSTGLTASITTGSIFGYTDNAAQSWQLFYTKPSVTSMTGNLVVTGSEGRVELSSVPIFDNEWYNIAVTRNLMSGTINIHVRSIDEDIVDYRASASASLPITLTDGFGTTQIGLSLNSTTGSQMWAQEFRVWSQVLDDVELDDHALNFQSYGTRESRGDETLDIHWRMDDNKTVDNTGFLNPFVLNFAPNPFASLVSLHGRTQNYEPDENPFVKVLLDYNYIASVEYGWNEEKVRIISGSSVSPEAAYQDNPMVGLEFNLMDALNEDISQIVSSLDGFNEYIGSPVDAYRDSYVDLDIMRKNYFQRLGGSINFRVFADLLEFFDRSFVDMVKKLIPARATFLGDEFVVESHMLERPKVQWNYRRREPEFQPEGVIQIYIRS